MSGIFDYNLLVETLIVFGLIANYLVERVLPFVTFVLTENSGFTFKISMNIALEGKWTKYSSAPYVLCELLFEDTNSTMLQFDLVLKGWNT